MTSLMRDRFFSYVVKTDGCWNWVGGRNRRDGWAHGQFRVGAKRFQAHRFSYQLAGKLIPDGYHLHHKCENPFCVRPGHLTPLAAAHHTRLHNTKPCIHGNPKSYCPDCRPARLAAQRLYWHNRQAARKQQALLK